MNQYQINKLTDYQIASTFKPILSHIYKNKMEEINEELQEVYAHLDQFDVPRYSDFDRAFARLTLPQWAKDHFKTIDHINRIRRIKVNDKKTSEEFNIEKARMVPIESFYTPVVKKGRQMTCYLHEDRNPSAILNKNNTIKCFSCNTYSDSITVFMHLNKMNFKDAVRAMVKL